MRLISISILKTLITTTLIVLLHGFSFAESKNVKIHKVVKRDTLWDISEKYLENPFLWPKLWQWNDYITNPHFIYPGNNIRLYPPEVIVKHPHVESEEIDEVEVEVQEVQEVEVEQEKSEIERTKEVPKHSFPELKSTGLISLNEMEKAGKILNAEDEKVMLTTGDIVYVTLDESPSRGDIYTIFDVQDKIIHPVTEEYLGYKVTILGRMEIISFDAGLATAKIIKAYNAILRGNDVMKQPTLPESISLIHSESSLDGYIIGTKEDQKSFGENDIVYLDLGKEDGVVAGNSFIIYKKGDVVTEKTTDIEYTLPSTTIGRLLIIDVKENSSAAIIIDSIEEMHVGERIKAETK